MKSGGICLIFGGTRTHHRLVCAFEDAGFEIKDEMQWIYGSGFPKSYNISKGFDKKAGAERQGTGEFKIRHGGGAKSDKISQLNPDWKETEITLPTTDLAKQWDGWGTALKPAQEPIMVCQKPIEKNYCYNIEKYGVGGINIDACRIDLNGDYKCKANGRPSITGLSDNYDSGKANQPDTLGRFPSNLLLDDVSAEILDKQSGILKSGAIKKGQSAGTDWKSGDISHEREGGRRVQPKDIQASQGGASRFFYSAKASKKDKTENGLINNTHVTVKPTELIKYLVKLVTPPQGICLDICEGSGTHVKAVLELNKEGFDFNYIGFENDEESYNIACEREKIHKVAI
jgi:site-specific DNA-methyltransferase (adenine-specific)